MAKATQSGNIAAQGIKGTSTSKPTTSASSSKKKKDELFQKTGDTFVDTYIQSRMTGASAQGAGEAAYNATHSSGKYLDPGISSRVTEGLANGTMYEKNGRYYYTDEAQKQYEKTAAEQYADRVKETTAQNAWANSGKSFLDRFKSAEGMTHEEFLERQRSGATAGIGAVQAWLGDLASAAGSVVNSVQDIVDKRNAVKPAATDKLNHGYTADEIAEKNRKLAEGLLNAGDALTAKGMLNIQNSKDSTTTKAGNVAVDIVTNAIQMGLDGVSQPIFGRWTTFFLRSLGSSAREARVDENIETTNTQQIAYGAAKGLIEVGTEKMFDGLAGLFGKGLADDLVKKFVARHAKTDFGQSVLTILAGMGGEGVEEIMSDLVDPIAKKLTYDKNAELADKSEILYDGFVGAMLGAFGSGADVIRGTSNFAGDAQAVVDYGRNSGDAKAAANAERAGKTLASRGSISNFAAERSVGGNLTEEIYAKAIMDEAAARKQEKEKTEATQKFFKGTNAEGTDFSRKVDTFAKTNFEGKDRDITMTQVDGQNMVKLTAADNSSVAMTLDEAEANNAIPEDVHDFMVQLDAKLGEYAEAAYNAYDGSMSTGDYIRALDYGASVLAANNISLDTAGKDTDVGNLTPTQKKLAVSIGQNMAKNRVTVIGQKGNGTLSFGKTENLQEGMNVISEETARSVWGEEADDNINYLQTLAETTGLDFVVFDSKIREYEDENGNKRIELGSKQGMYSTAGTIYIDARAGQSKEGFGKAVLSYTMSHELTHFLEHNAGKSYDELKSFVLDNLSGLSEGKTLQELVEEKMAVSSTPMSYDDAVSEVIADSCETMLQNSKYIAQVAQEKPTLAQKIKDWIDSFLEKLRATLKGRHEGAKYFESSVELLQKLSALWDQALQDAIANTSAAEQIGIEIDAKTESAAPGDVTQLSERSWTESDYVQKKEEAAQELAKSLNISVQRAMEYIDSVNSVAKTIANDRMRLDYQASEGVSSLVGNTEYGGSIDFSTICKKRRLLTGTFTAIQNALPNTALTADEILTIRKMMKDKGYEVSCGLCYVEGSRAKMGEYAKQFLDEYAKTNPDYLPNMSEINTPEGIEKIRTQYPDVYEAYETFMNSLAQRKPKLYQLATEYKNEIYQKFKNNRKQVEKYNYNGGLRLQSFSDFEIIHLIDNMQVIMDMANVGLAGQAYTKVPEFAWAMGKTGLKINLSLIAKGVENGKLVLDDVEGMKRADAQALRNAYSDNVGTILVVFNDEQLKAAMADDFIDYIIPFHRSQWNSKQYELMGLPANAKDFTMWQNESYIEPVYNKNGKKTRPSNYMPNGYWDFSKTGTENAEAYLRMCAQNNRTPKFSFLLDQNEDGSYSLKKDGSTDGYWKLLIDFKMYNNDGIGVPQQPVQPIFNEGPESDPHTTLGMLKAYEGGHQSFPVAQDIVDKFVKDYKASHKDVEQFSLRGVRDDGIEVYETSDETLSLSWKERKQRFINYLSNYYRGRTAKFMRNGHPYYARFDYVDANKNVYGDTKSDSSGRDAKINTGADGDIFTLSENMSYRNSTPETGKKSPAHRDVRYWDYYVKTVQIDGKVFDITANIRVKPEGEYVYYLQLVENKNIKAASPRIDPKSLGDLNGVPTAYETSVSQTSDESNDYLQEFGTSSQYSERDTSTGVPEEDAEAARKYFGSTNRLSAAGYLTVNGTMLDFSGIHDGADDPNTSTVDHREISEAFGYEYGSEWGYSGAMLKFMDAGNIRVIPETNGIELMKKPNSEQADKLYDLFDYFRRQNPAYGITVDLDTFNGVDTSDPYNIRPDLQTTSVNYTAKTSAGRIIKDINAFFDNGTIPEGTGNGIEQFSWSERDNAKSDRELLVDALDTVAQNDEEVSQLENYRKNVKRLNELDKKLTSEQKILRKLVAGGGSDAEIAEQRQKVRDMQQKLTAQDQKLLNLQATTPLKNVLTRERKRVSDETRRMVRERMQNREDVVKYRAQVEKKTKRLYRLLSEETIQRHVPNVLQQPLAEFLDSINFDSRRRLSGGESTKKDLKMDQIATELGRILSNQQKYINGDENVEGFGGYIDISEESLQTLEEMGQKVRDAARTTGGEYTVNQMTAAELKDLSKLLSNIYTGINNINNFMANERYTSVKAAADEDMAHMDQLGAASEKADNRFRKIFTWKNAVPHFAMKRYGTGAEAIQTGYERGWEKLAMNAQEVIDFAKEAYTSDEVRSWEHDIREIKLEDGSKIKISIAQIMALGQHMNQQQSVQHMEKGGIRIGEIQRGTGDKKINDVKHYHLTEKDLENILGLLSDRQVEVAYKIQSFMAQYGSKKGNEISRRRFGYDAFTEGENYYPIKTDDNTRPMQPTDDQSSSLFRLLNLGSTKKRNPKANNALVINSIFDTFAEHSADMAKYNAMALPVLDAIKYFNYNVKNVAEDGSFSVRSMQGAMEQAFGKEAKNYYRTLLKDINGVHEGGDRTSDVFNLASNYKVAAVAANLRVALLQPTSYVRASYVIEPKYLAAAFGMKNGYKEAMKYSGTAVWKSLGFYDTNIARGLRDQIKNDPTIKDRLVEKSMKGAEIGDQRTWGRLWNACKLQTKAETGLTGEELNVKTADLFREVVYSSQVMDSTLTRSELMRGTTQRDKALTAFMAEPTLSYNILMNAYSQYQLDARAKGKDKALRENSGKIAKAFTVYAASAAFSAIVESFVDAVRDNDDEEFWKKFLQAFLGEGDNVIEKFYDGNLGSDLSFIGKLPYAKTIISAIQGFGNTDMSSEGIESLINAVRILDETIKLKVGLLDKPTELTYYGKMTKWGKVYKLLQPLSQLSGLPASAAARDGLAIWNNFAEYVLNAPELKVRTYDKNMLSQSKQADYEQFVKGTGISQKQYQKVLQDANTNGNSSVTQDELGTYLQASTLSAEEQYAIWVAQGWKKTYDEWLDDN